MKNHAQIAQHQQEPMIKMTNALRLGEIATPERAKHDGGLAEDVIARALNGAVLLRRQRARYNCLLDEYLAKGKLTDDQYHSGMRFRMDYRGAYQVGKTSAFARMIASKGSYAFSADYSVDCRARLSEYAKTLGCLFKIVEAVCGWDQRPGDGRSFQKLRRGLDALATV